jgi:glutamate formiminotransferase/glutamate formiminotransferase/formiminotetrahydrofolate cyclodeaminase
VILECVVNVSEGRNREVLDHLTAAAGPALLDRHTDPHHHRTVLTLAGASDDVEAAVRTVAERAVAEIDLGSHHGVHPRLGALDVVPFVSLEEQADGTLGEGDPNPAVGARDRFATWCADTLGVPCFVYGAGAGVSGGGGRTLPEVRRGAFTTLSPDTGPAHPLPRTGAVAVGARPLLVAYNLFLRGADLATARRVASELRGRRVRTLGLDVGGFPQVSCNLVEPWRTGPLEVYERVATLAAAQGATIDRAELVGLLPAGVLARIPTPLHAQLDVDADRTIEARLRARGPGGV